MRVMLIPKETRESFDNFDNANNLEALSNSLNNNLTKQSIY